MRFDRPFINSGRFDVVYAYINIYILIFIRNINNYHNIPFIAHRGGNGPSRCLNDVYKGVAIFTLHRFFDVFLSLVTWRCGHQGSGGVFKFTRTCLMKKK